MKRTFCFLAVTAFAWGLSVIAGCDRKAAGPQAMPPAQVTVMTVQSQQIELDTELPGRTSPFLIAEIRPQVNGLVQKRLFVEGSDVKTGQVLYQIDPAPFQAACDSAQAYLQATKKAVDRTQAGLQSTLADIARQQATLDLAKTNRQRYEDLFAENAVSANDRDQAVTQADVAQATLRALEADLSSRHAEIAAAQAEVQRAEASLQTAQINLGYTRITAPISGRIGRSAVTDGAIVTAYQAIPLAIIQQLDPVYVDIPQSTADLMRWQRRLEDGRLRHGGDAQKKVKLLLENNRAYPLTGELQFRDVSVDATTGSVIVRAVFANPQGVLLPNMFVRAIVAEGVSDQAILIPQQAVLRDSKGNPMAMIVNAQSQVEARMLKVDRAVGSQWLVTSGLTLGDQVIVEGLQRVRPGVAVQTSPYQPGVKP